MTSNFLFAKKYIYDNLKLEVSDFFLEEESQDYEACRFKTNNWKIIGRNAKITPTKVGQFVTVWKRKENGPIEPFQILDDFDFFVINTRTENNFGQFVFPKSILLKKHIISSEKKGGKRGIRVYPTWDKTISNQSIKTQKWQLNYFLDLTNEEKVDLDLAKKLYTIY